MSFDKYEAKENYANKIMAENAKVETLTEEQHDALESLCKIRHNMHSNKAIMFNSEAANSELWGDYDRISELLEEAKLPKLTLPDSSEDFTVSYDYDIDDRGLSFSEWCEEAEQEFFEQMEDVNNKIERYLKDIDEVHGTHYCPTGLSRF